MLQELTAAVLRGSRLLPTAAAVATGGRRGRSGCGVLWLLWRATRMWLWVRQGLVA